MRRAAGAALALLLTRGALAQDVDPAALATRLKSKQVDDSVDAATELGRGNLEQVLIRGTNGYVVMVKAKSGTMLLTLTTKEAKLGLIFLDMSRAVEDIDRIL